MAFVNHGPDHRRFEWILRDAGKDQILRNGERAGGWMNVWTDQASLLAVIRDAWQQYPFELELEQTTARVHLWPKHGRLWDTSFDGIWHFLTDDQKRRHVKRKPKVGDKRFDEVWEKLHEADAQGAAKTHEIWLFFGPRGHWNIGNTQYADLVQQPIYAHADLAWQCETRALDWCPHTPYDMTRFPHEENRAETMLDLMQLHVDYQHKYGWWDWGGYHQHLEISPGAMRYGDDTFGNTHHLSAWHRANPKSHYYWGSYPWLMYLRTGRSPWRRYGQTYTLYSADRAFRHHTDESSGRIAGEEYHYDNSEIHWIGGWYGYPGGAMPMGNITDRHDYVYQYWLTGDRRPLDVLKTWAEGFDAQIKAGDQWLQRMVDAGPYGNWSRNIGGALNRFCIHYEATRDERYLKYAEMMAKTFHGLNVREGECGTKGDASGTPSCHWHSAWVYEGLFRYYMLTGDEAVKKTAIDYCRAATDLGAGFGAGGNESGILNWCTYGYELTRDPLFLELGRRMVDREMSAWVSQSAFKPGGRKFRVVTMPRFLGAMASAPEEWRSRNLPTSHRGLSLDLRYYHPNWGGKTKRVFLLDETDQPFSIHFAAFQAGTFAVFDPDGKLVANTEIDWLKSIRATLAVPKDGKKGTYTLMCVAPGKTYYSKRWWDYPAHVNIIACDLDTIVYEASSRRGEDLAFRARAWYFGVPAGAKGVEVHWRPAAKEGAGQRHFAVEEVSGPYRQSTRDMTPENHHSAEAYGDFYRYTFRIPPADRDRVFRCEPLHERHRVLVHESGSPGRGFVIIGAPPYVATSPDSYFVPRVPSEYEQVEAGSGG